MAIAVYSKDQSQAEALAVELGLPCVSDDLSHFSHVLEFELGKLQLRALRKGAPGAVRVDFVEGALVYRRQYSGKQSEAIARAVGLRKKSGLSVLDATAGLGRDAFILAALGCEVTLLEKNKIVAALLQDGLKRALEDPNVSEIAQRMHFIQTDAENWMRQASGFDVVYLDPMFPARRKSALVKKDMQLLQEIADETLDASALFEAAMACAHDRIVVKRPKLGENLAKKSPSYCIHAGSARFDVYKKC